MADLEVCPRDVWVMPDDSEMYVIKSVSNTSIKALTIGSWTDKFNVKPGTEFWPVEFSIHGFEYFISKGLNRAAELDKSIKI